MKCRGIIAFATLMLAIGSACPDKATGPYAISTLPPASNFAVGPGDVFEVRVFDEANLSGPYRVDADGTIDFPLVGRIKVQGLTSSQIADAIKSRLEDGYLKKASVSVLVKEYNSKKVTVLGQVKAPGTFPYTDNMSVVEAISRAGGFTALARKNNVRVTRIVDGKTQTIIVAVEDIGRGKAPNFLLWPGDNVYVDDRML